MERTAGGTEGTGEPARRSPWARVRRLLPPLVVLALAVVLVLRLAGEPDRAASRRRIQERTATIVDVDRHLDVYGADPEDRDAAAEAYIRLERIDKAITAVFGNLRGPIDPKQARDFARTAIHHLGWTVPERFEEPRWLAPLALTALCDGGDPRAQARMREIGARERIEVSIHYFLVADQRGTKPALESFVAGLRGRKEEMYRPPAAMASMRPEPYPERTEDLATLLQILEGELRHQDPLRWTSACLALGRSEDAEATTALRELAHRLGASANPSDKEDAALAACGLVAAGDWSEEALLLPFVDSTEAMPVVARWYARAVVWRDERGDPEARDRLRRLWYGKSQLSVGDLRTSMATRLFLQDRLAEGDALFDAFVRDLTSPPSRVVEQVVGHCARLRRGEAEALRDILRLVREPEGFLATESSPGGGPQTSHPSITGMRAIYLYALPRPPN